MYFFQGGYYNAQSSMDNAIGMKLSLKAKVQGARADQRGMASVKRRTDGRTHAEKKSRASQFRGRSEVAISVSFGTRNSIWDSTWLAMATPPRERALGRIADYGTVLEIKPHHMSSSTLESPNSSSPLNKDIRNERLPPSLLKGSNRTLWPAAAALTHSCY